ncbi:hypothetical protein VTN00DRAFT_7938 [Thermoascus crustaceus]|uniref:uncharacterized protein n=1 Tax=Thermoascus crustaceus TaxID=5088 RepID=UPI003741F296
MSSAENDEFSDLDEEDFLAAATQAGAFDSPRPAKRRRLRAPKDARDEANNSSSQAGEDHSANEDGYSGAGSSSFTDNDLPPPPRRSFSTENEADSPKQVRSKYKIFVPKHSNVQEETFVTQLTQPHSSPSRIRGPRWKKPDPEIVAAESNAGPSGADSDKDEDLRAAIVASLESFRAENSGKAACSFSNDPAQEHPVPASHGESGTVQQDLSFDLDDIPEDAFDSSPSLSPHSPAINPIPASSRPPATQSASRPRLNTQRTNLRQTTLFDLAARNTNHETQEAADCWFPAERDEPPTHHKLDREAMKTWVYPTNLGKIRDYQFNITQKGLFHNLLVALPTGLGKTFIAATIMLNWFRWTKDAQIVFVAPTKPLVSQQVTACFEVAGIPRSKTTMLTGNAAPGVRAEEWQTKRVFFMTPQTLVNDLKTGIADPKRIVLLVVDEAHRATGGYAYVEVVKFLRRFNKSFRVLALTATPGSTVESVQAVIDGLDIARVEIRTEQSLDIREYVHARNIDVQTFGNSEEMVLCMDLLSKALQPAVDQLRSLNAYWGRDPMTLTAYGLTKARQQWMGSDAGRNASFPLKGKVNAIFTVLASLAHSIDLLKYHGITPFYRSLLNFQSNTDGQKGGKYQRQIVQDENFKKLMSYLQPWASNPEFIGHPKLEYLREVVLNHFMDAGEGLGADGRPSSNTRIMIFVHFRDSAEEVTRVLKRHEPMIRPHVFVGQTSAKGSDGMDQKTQLSIVEKFKKGTYNTIVATSIGEEGLDIGEVDLIVCYDSSASPIRMLQRMGRTGRKRAGNIVLLLMRGKEEESYLKAKDNYEKMQQMIASGSRFTFHEDRSPRILPRDAKPEVDKRQIEVPLENSQQELPEPKKRARTPKRPPKKFHMPDDVETGFTKASCLGRGNKATGKSPENKKPNPRTPTPEPVDIPPLEDVLLSSAQQRELELRYCNVGGTTPQFVHRPRNDAFPHLQRVPRPMKFVKHGSVTRRMIETLQRMDATGADCEDRYRKILDLEREAAVNRPAARSRSSPETLAEKPTKAKSKASSSGPARPRPSRIPENSAAPSDSGNIRQSSPLMCSPLQPDNLEQKPFYASQLSDVEDIDTNFELPDVSTLVDVEHERTSSRRRNRAIFDDDSDE